MDDKRIARMVGKIAADGDPENDDAFASIDQAVDTMIAAYKTIMENLPAAKTENVPQRAALDEIKETMEEGVGPYLGDVVKALQVFGE